VLADGVGASGESNQMGINDTVTSSESDKMAVDNFVASGSSDQMLIDEELKIVVVSYFELTEICTKLSDVGFQNLMRN